MDPVCVEANRTREPRHLNDVKRYVAHLVIRDIHLSVPHVVIEGRNFDIDPRADDCPFFQFLEDSEPEIRRRVDEMGVAPSHVLDYPPRLI